MSEHNSTPVNCYITVEDEENLLVCYSQENRRKSFLLEPEHVLGDVSRMVDAVQINKMTYIYRHIDINILKCH